MTRNEQPAGVVDAAEILNSIGEAAYEWQLDTDALTWSRNAAPVLGLADTAEIASGKAYALRTDATGGQSRVDAVNAPIVISSLGAFGVRAAAPIVVPPSVGTLFVGSAHHEMLGDGKKKETAEVITLSLTFDHRVVNGAGAASFVHEIKEQIENFKIPSGVIAAN